MGSFHTSSHQPSGTLMFSTALAAAFIPLVPEASLGRSGVFSHTSDALHHGSRDRHVIVFEEHDVPAQHGIAADLA